MKFKDLKEEEKKKYKKFICNTKEFQNYVNMFIEDYEIDDIINEYKNYDDQLCSIQVFVRELKDKVIGYENISGNKIYGILEKHNVLYKENKWVPYKKFIDKGYFIIDTMTMYTGDSAGDVVYITRITNKGKEWLIDNLEKIGLIKRLKK